MKKEIELQRKATKAKTGSSTGKPKKPQNQKRVFVYHKFDWE